MFFTFLAIPYALMEHSMKHEDMKTNSYIKK